ncbi:MAG: putative metal-dependent hydrolase [Longimicrobiales bacterium]|nr:putative metal-dependent hydrolase [Longimicrobiales bacterium]
MSTRPELDALRYPIGRLERAAEPTPEDRARWIAELERLPAELRSAVEGLDAARLDTPYREGGWTVRQVVHHVADSHVNGYVRFTLAVAEAGRTAALYDQDAWAALPFVRTGPVEPSLTLLDGLHARWAATARSLGTADFGRTIEHPEHGAMTVDDLLNLYAWHSRHHVAHVHGLREREGW